MHPKNIIVRMPNWLGDMVMATPILADLRNHWPETKITACCQGALATVIQEDPHIDEIFSFERPRYWWNQAEVQKITTRLQEKQYDLGILLTNSFSSAYLFWRGKILNRIGYATNGRSLLLHSPIPFPKTRDTQHLVTTYKMLLDPLKIGCSHSAPMLYLSKEERKQAEQQLKIAGIESSDYVIGINPGAAYGSAKCWLPERFEALTKKLLHFPTIKVIYFGDKKGTPLVENICRKFPNRVLNMAGKTSLRELMALIAQCHLFLTNDSGPMHLASALQIPLIALFGSTSDQTTGPYGGGKILHKRVSCSPCYRRECPIDFRCMKQITVEEVYDAIHSFIAHAHE